ncbi:type IV secretion system DNA-binding domain-containing protein [Candidatus Peregrinibacteria bacterium]|nr:type IV secretion system DNA-binding domain-containing protein [Candidatus Peregrinibacteria bacterium]
MSQEQLLEVLQQTWQFIIRNPIQILVSLILGFLLIRFLFRLSNYLYTSIVVAKRLVHLKVTLPREESQKDKEKSEIKDFKEMIGVMEQFFRNLHEIGELSLSNRIKTWFFKDDIVSFEIVAKDKVVDFYVVVQKRYFELVEKQITSYYPHADIQTEDPINIQPKGNKIKCFFAFQQRPFYYPLKTFKDLGNDPLNDLTNIFSKFDESDVAVIQMVVRPNTKNKWRKKTEEAGSQMFSGKNPSKFKIPGLGFLGSFLGALVWGGDKFAKEQSSNENAGPYGAGGYVRMLQTREEIAKKIGEKAGNVYFDTKVRIIGSGKTWGRALEITNNIALGLNLFKDAQMNWFQTRRIILIDRINNFFMKYNFLRRVLYARFFGLGEKLSLLDSAELASVYHFPSSRFNYTPIINWLKYKVLPAPVDLPNEGIILGHNVYRGEKKLVRIMRKDRTRHHYCIGKSGAGKSAFLSYMARQDMANGDGVCVVDPHGDLIEELVQFVPKERAKDVIIFNPADTERPMGLNILEAQTAPEMDLASSQATEIFIKIFGDEIFGPRIQHYFRNGCLTLMEDEEEGATLIDVPRIFVDEDFMKYKVSKVKNPVVRSFWEHEYSHTGERERQEMIPYFSSKFGPFITNSIMRNTIGQTKSAFNFRRVMDDQKILLINLSKGKMGDLNTQLLGLVVVARLQMAAMSRVDMPESERKDFYLYVDEFQNFATDSFASILSEARKYRLALIMAHQYIKQLERKQDTSIRDAVFGNVGTMMSFKVGADDAEYMAKEYAPVLTEQDVLGIANYKAYIRLNINNSTSRPFSLETIYDMSSANPKIGDIVKQYSRMKYGRKKEFVDQEIAARIGIDLA